MQIVFNDEFDKLTPEMWNLMERAADIALRTEFSELKSIDLENEPELGVTVVDDSEILELNREYREKDSVTDVLSFPQFEGHDDLLEDLLDDETETLIGDVVICIVLLGRDELFRQRFGIHINYGRIKDPD